MDAENLEGLAAVRTLWVEYWQSLSLSPDSCEAKRLYVHPGYRRRGTARRFLSELIGEARQAGYRTMYGDTLPAVSSALELYRETGFVEAGPYSAEPTPGAIYLRLGL
jgi:GNAT superfamily N-acetyltransferase